MRKNTLLIILFVLPVLCSQAQEKNRIGFKAGVGFYRQNFKFDGEQRYFDFKPGIVVGFFKEIHFNQYVNFQPELMYIGMGSKNDGNTNKASYVSLPMLFKFHGKRLGLVVGPQMSVLLGAKLIDEFDGKEDVKDNYKSVDIGVIGGLELSFAKNNRGLVGVRYQLAINDVAKDSPPRSFLKNTGIQAYVGFRF